LENWDRQYRHHKGDQTMKRNQASWIVDSMGRVKLVLPDLYGNPQVLSHAEIMGRFTLDQIISLRATLPTIQEVN